MPNEKIIKMMLAKTDYSREQIMEMNTVDCIILIESIPKKPKATRNHNYLPEVSFTGFQKSKREELEQVAIKNNFHVVQTVTNNLQFLVAGFNASEIKLNQATEKGLTIISEEQFTKLF